VGQTAFDTVEYRYDTEAPVITLGPIERVGDDFQYTSLNVNDPLQNSYASEGFTYDWTTDAKPTDAPDLLFSPSGNIAQPLISTQEPHDPAWDGEYNVQLVVTDEAGNVSLAAVDTVLIDHNSPIPGPQPSAGSIAANSFELNWNLAWDSGDPNGLVYRIGIATDPIELAAETDSFSEVLAYGQSFSKGSTTGKYVIDGLNQGQTYWFKLQVRDSVGNAAEYSTGSVTTDGAQETGFTMTLDAIQNASRTLITDVVNQTVNDFNVSINNTVDKSSIIPVFSLSDGARVEFDNDPSGAESMVPVISGVTVLDLSVTPNVFRVTSEDGANSQDYQVNLLYNGTELQVYDFIIPNRVDDQPVGVDGDPMDGQGLVDNGNHTIAMTIPFLVQTGERLEGAFYLAQIQASAGATVSLNGGATLANDPNNGSLPGIYASSAISPNVDYMDAGNPGINRPSFDQYGLGDYYAEVLVTAEDGSTQVYNLTVQEDYVAEIPNATFMMIIDWPSSPYPKEIWRSGEFNRFGIDFVVPRVDQPYRTVYWDTIVTANIDYEGTIFYNGAFEVQFLDGNNFTTSNKYPFVEIDNDYINTIAPSDNRILIDRADNGGGVEVIADGDVAVLKVDLPNNGTDAWPVDAYAMDRSD
jgi:hypothetical protein